MNVDINQLMQSAGLAVRQSREALEIARGTNEALLREVAALKSNAAQLQGALSRLQIERQADNNVQRVENIPGRRIPFDLLVDIPIPANSSSPAQGTITITQEGPFVAVWRFATLCSFFSYSVAGENGAVASFQGRSYGRFRPIHSAWDLNDGQPYSEITQAVAFPGSGAPHMVSPSNQASFRSMQGDFRILFENAGSSFPRSNIRAGVPSTFWTRAINEPFELGALDFFERGEVLSFTVNPLHVANPPAGNVTGFAPTNPAFPFASSQFDAVEGVVDQADADLVGSADPVTRSANAILTIGFHGYKIVQPPGAGPY